MVQEDFVDTHHLTVNEIDLIVNEIDIKDLQCPICLDFYSSPISLSVCGHTVDRECIARSKRDSSESGLVCPICRAAVDEKALAEESNVLILGMVARVCEHSSNSQIEEHRRAVRQARCLKSERLEKSSCKTWNPGDDLLISLIGCFVSPETKEYITQTHLPQIPRTIYRVLLILVHVLYWAFTLGTLFVIYKLKYHSEIEKWTLRMEMLADDESISDQKHAWHFSDAAQFGWP